MRYCLAPLKSSIIQPFKMTTNIIIRDLEALKQAMFDLTGHPVNVQILKSKNRDFGIGQKRCVERFNRTYTLLHKEPTLLLRMVSAGQYSLIAAYLPRVIARKPRLEMLRIPVQQTASKDSIWASSHRIANETDASRPADYFSVTYGIAKHGNVSTRTHRLCNKLADLTVLRDLQGLFATLLPEHCKRQLAAAHLMPAGPFVGTCFTSLAMNESSIDQHGLRKFGGTAVHQDTDAKGSLQASVMLENTAKGAGYLLFPDYKMAVNQQAGDVVFMNPYEWHGTDGNIDLITKKHRRIPGIFFMTGIKAVKFRSKRTRAEAALQKSSPVKRRCRRNDIVTTQSVFRQHRWRECEKRDTLSKSCRLPGEQQWTILWNSWIMRGAFEILWHVWNKC